MQDAQPKDLPHLSYKQHNSGLSVTTISLRHPKPRIHPPNPHQSASHPRNV